MSVPARPALLLALLAAPLLARGQTMLDQEQRLIDIHCLLLDLPAVQAPGAFGGPSRGVIGYAESNDGITWVKVPQPGPNGEALSTGATGEFDSVGLTTPSVFVDGAFWLMYYAGFDANGVFLTGLARAPR